MEYVIQLLNEDLKKKSNDVRLYQLWLHGAQKAKHEYGVEVYSRGLVSAQKAIAELPEAIKYLVQKSNNDTPPQLNKHDVSRRADDRLTFNSSIQQLMAKVHDEVEGRYDLTAEDLFDIEHILMLSQHGG